MQGAMIQSSSMEASEPLSCLRRNILSVLKEEYTRNRGNHDNGNNDGEMALGYQDETDALYTLEGYEALRNLDSTRKGLAWCAAFAIWVLNKSAAQELPFHYVQGDWLNANLIKKFDNYGVVKKPADYSPRRGDMIIFQDIEDEKNGAQYVRGHIAFVETYNASTQTVTTLSGNAPLRDEARQLRHNGQFSTLDGIAKETLPLNGQRISYYSNSTKTGFHERPQRIAGIVDVDALFAHLKIEARLFDYSIIR